MHASPLPLASASRPSTATSPSIKNRVEVCVSTDAAHTRSAASTGRLTSAVTTPASAVVLW